MLHLIKKTITIEKKYEFVPGHPFNPLTFDAGNLLAAYNGDTLPTDPANTWSDASGNGHNLTLFNAPTIINPAINGHVALRFDGVNQYGRSLSIVNGQPLTIYTVIKQITWTAQDCYINGGASDSRFRQVGLSPDLTMYAGALDITVNPQLALNAYGILSLTLNGANSEIRLNNNIAVVGNPGANSINQFYVASRVGIANFFNGELAYIIIRNGADNTATQNLFINYFKNRFAI